VRFNEGLLSIPIGCTYLSHTYTQLHRDPLAPIVQAHDEFTEYIEVPYVDTMGRIKGFKLTVRAEKKNPSQSPSISMQLTVAMMCPRDTEGVE
jgi:hypothetical protein